MLPLQIRNARMASALVPSAGSSGLVPDPLRSMLVQRGLLEQLSAAASMSTSALRLVAGRRMPCLATEFHRSVAKCRVCLPDIHGTAQPSLCASQHPGCQQLAGGQEQCAAASCSLRLAVCSSCVEPSVRSSRPCRDCCRSLLTQRGLLSALICPAEA